jgi:hypothetical protein
VRLFEHPDFDQVILQAAEHFQLRPAIIEKDFQLVVVDERTYRIFAGGNRK